MNGKRKEKLLIFDANATTPVCDEAKDVMAKLEGFSGINLANPLSDQAQIIGKIIDELLGNFSTMLGVSADNIIFTSGASESNATICFTIAQNYNDRPKKASTKKKKKKSKNVVISSIEHKNMLMSVKTFLEPVFEIRYVKPNKGNIISVKDTMALVDDDTVFVSVMAVNNETGIVNDYKKISKACWRKGIHFHCDATQLIGKEISGLDYCTSFCGSFHKLAGPKGVGFLFSSDDIVPMIPGTQQKGKRGGTFDFVRVAGGLTAFLTAHKDRKKKNKWLAESKKRIEGAITSALGEGSSWGEISSSEDPVFIIKGKGAHKSKKTSFTYCDGGACMPHVIAILLGKRRNSIQIAKALADKGVLIGVGSACNRPNETSHVLTSLDPTIVGDVSNMIRISLFDGLKKSDIDGLISAIELELPKFR